MTFVGSPAPLCLQGGLGISQTIFTLVVNLCLGLLGEKAEGAKLK